MIRLGALIVFLAALVAAAGHLLVATWQLLSDERHSTSFSAPLNWSPENAASASISDPVHAPVTAFATTIERPVFFQGRRIPAPVPAKLPEQMQQPVQAPPPARVLGPVKLLGVSIWNGHREALIEATSSPARWYAQGARIGDWTLSEVQPEAVVLSADRQTQLVKLLSVQ